MEKIIRFLCLKKQLRELGLLLRITDFNWQKWQRKNVAFTLCALKYVERTFIMLYKMGLI